MSISESLYRWRAQIEQAVDGIVVSDEVKEADPDMADEIFDAYLDEERRRTRAIEAERPGLKKTGGA